MSSPRPWRRKWLSNAFAHKTPYCQFLSENSSGLWGICGVKRFLLSSSIWDNSHFISIYVFLKTCVGVPWSSLFFCWPSWLLHAVPRLFWYYYYFLLLSIIFLKIFLLVYIEFYLLFFIIKGTFYDFFFILILIC